MRAAVLAFAAACVLASSAHAGKYSDWRRLQEAPIAEAVGSQFGFSVEIEYVNHHETSHGLADFVEETRTCRLTLLNLAEGDDIAGLTSVRGLEGKRSVETFILLHELGHCVRAAKTDIGGAGIAENLKAIVTDEWLADVFAVKAAPLYGLDIDADGLARWRATMTDVRHRTEEALLSSKSFGEAASLREAWDIAERAVEPAYAAYVSRVSASDVRHSKANLFDE